MVFFVMDTEQRADPLFEDLTPENREERLKRHCVKTTQALLYRSEPLKDVCFKCSDQEYSRAHKFVLGTQCQYFRSVLYREGIMNVSMNSIKGKKYRFTFSSRCFRSLLEFLYTGQILAVEEQGIDDCLEHVGELLSLSRQPNSKKDGMGGLDTYLIKCFQSARLMSIRAAMMRLDIAMKSNVQEIMDTTRAAIPNLAFATDAFQDVGPEVVELILRDVPLQATEIVVWRAVKAWSDTFFDNLSDDGLDMSPTASSPPEDKESGPVVPEALKHILQFVDLDCINWKEVTEEILPTKLFDNSQIRQAKRTQAIKRTGLLPSRQSERRGVEAEDAGCTILS